MHGIAPDDGTPPNTEEEANKKDPGLINGSSGNLPEKTEDDNNSESENANQIIVIVIQEIATFYTMFKEENEKIEKEDLKE